MRIKVAETYTKQLSNHIVMSFKSDLLAISHALLSNI